MKKIVFSFTKILATVFLFSACGAGNNSVERESSSSKEESPQKATTQISDIVFIKVDSVILNYDMYHDFKAELEKKAKKMDADLDAKIKAWEKDMTAFREKNEKMLLTHSQEQEQSTRLLARQKELQEEIIPKLRNELAEQENIMNRTINDAIQTYVDKYNAEKKYALILNGAVVLSSGNKAMDITGEILKGLNQEYIAGKSSK